MSSRTTIDDSDEGKKVVNANGDDIGVVSEVRGNTAHVDPDPGITDQIRAKLGWDDADKDTYALPESSIDQITDDEVRLGRNM
jgi:hypothetical protein